MVMHVARLLLDAGHRPAIAMRGYAQGPDGVSDEAEEYGRALPGVPVVARPDRAEGLIGLFGSEAGSAYIAASASRRSWSSLAERQSMFRR